ncbi:MAG TPA: MBL fold metallo-hydrolase, partial [Gaiellaceae bacterium]|nr:MBL fold metallo-hydrolase [Gaiellaceae bacterium]
MTRLLFKQFLDDDLGCACYLVGDEHAGVAVVVDPPYSIEPLLEEAGRRDVRIVGVVETHTHADHVSGHGRLALEHGISIRVHSAAGATFAHEPLEDGTEIDVGDVVLRTIHTPGHRPEHCCFAVIDRSRGDDPWLVLTGDSLFVGDAGRPDLAVDVQEGAEGMFHSLRRIVELGDGVEVFPGHVAGSLCGAAMSSKASTTIGFERRFNHALQGGLQEFVEAALGSQPPRPPNMERIVELNRGALLGAQPPLERLESVPEDAIVLDVRPTPAFAAGHHPGAVGIPISGSSFATKAGFVLPERPLLLHATDEGEAVRAARSLHAVGLFEIAGWQEGGGSERLEPVSL